MKAYLQAWRLYLREQLVRYLRRWSPTAPLLTKLSLPPKPYRVNIGHPQHISIVLVGCGGTGSFAAHILAQLAAWAKDSGLDLRLILVDYDTVEEKNLVRQNFCPAEIGYPKAFTLAWRYSAAFGIKITPVVGKFSAQVLQEHLPNRHTEHGSLLIIVGAVDNAAARRDIVAAIEQRQGLAALLREAIWWIDSGNERVAGQVLAGNTWATEPQLSPLGYCTGLPYPHLQEPSLLQTREPDQPADALSCAELTLLEEQSAMINRTMATWIGVYLYRLIQSRDLTMMATWINLEAGAVRSTAITGGRLLKPQPAALARPTRVDPPPQATTDQADMAAETERLVCPNCDIGTLIDGQDEIDGVLVGIRFCDSCTYREDLLCPECGSYDVTDTLRTGPDGQVIPILLCAECHWQADLNPTPPP